MRSIRHWTPRYVSDRIRAAIYYRQHRDEPWLTARANELLPGLLKPDDIGMEFGSGRSTLWLAQRVFSVTSVEDNLEWYDKGHACILELGLKNVKLIHAAVPEVAWTPEGLDIAAPGYLAPIEDLAPSSLDFALIDGACRSQTAARMMSRIRPGGILIIDNANWYLPSKSRAPGSRGLAEGPASPVWGQVWHGLASWRKIWTSNGVTDTAIFVKRADRDMTSSPGCLVTPCGASFNCREAY